MNLFELIFKQMRQRLLSTVLTCLSIFLGMALATSILILKAEGRQLFAQTDYGYDLVIGPKGSPLQLVLNTVYHMQASQGNIPYRIYEGLAVGTERMPDGSANPYWGLARWAVPYAVGDSYRGFRIVGTSSKLFGVNEDGTAVAEERYPEYRKGRRYTFAAGGAFDFRKFEAVVGSEVAKKTGLHVGSTFKATHGLPGFEEEEHEEVWTVTGILNETHTANDKVIFISLTSFYAIFEHAEGLGAAAQAPAGTQGSESAATKGGAEEKAYTVDGNGHIHVTLPKEEWAVSAILVASNETTATRIVTTLRAGNEAMAVQPAIVMADFFETFFAPTAMILMIIAALVTVVAGVGILVSIYNAVTSRYREIAIMRALGATRGRILATVCAEAGIVGVIGGIGGLVAAHLLGAAGSVFMERTVGTGIAWWRMGVWEVVYLLVVIALSLLAGLVPAMKAYRVPVAENL